MRCPNQCSMRRWAIEIPLGVRISLLVNAFSVLVAGEPPRLGHLDGVRMQRRRCGPGSEPDHVGGREGPRLVPEVRHVGHRDTDLLLDLAGYGGLERLARFDEPGQHREPPLRPLRVAAEEQPVVVVDHGHDHGGVGPRVVLDWSRVQRRIQPACSGSVGRATPRAELVDGVPVGQGLSGGEDAGVAVTEVHARVAEGLPVVVAALRGVADDGEVCGSLGAAVGVGGLGGHLLAEEEGEPVPVVRGRRPDGERAVREDLHALRDDDHHPGGGVGQELGNEIGFGPAVGGPVEAAARERKVPQRHATRSGGTRSSPYARPQHHLPLLPTWLDAASSRPVSTTSASRLDAASSHLTHRAR